MPTKKREDVMLGGLILVRTFDRENEFVRKKEGLEV